MELKDTLVTGAAVLAVGTSGVVGGNAVVDKVNDGPTKRQDATVQLVKKELESYIDERIKKLVPTTTGSVVVPKKQQVTDYRDNVPKR